ncbi:MAG: hypothetical protein H5U26_08625 [Immundisolibacter sp.]|jgi:hypothetical protein|uniref:hypothetical protein n=1 Tax=Immundisolibacter sp. TaxID=1934948 RepID=UPI0019B738E7|nr:hypothetical protein [Immundisolibacter sp.]MBC7162155.1 hypothetical protein [Immundisolibacter sp.]
MRRNLFNLKRGLSLLPVLLLTACGRDFQPGAYVDPQYGTTYEFGEDGRGKLIGGVPGTPSFTYQVSADAVTTSGAVNLTLKRINDKTLERPDGTRLVLRDDGRQ